MLIDSAIGAFGAEIGGSAGNTSHLTTAGKTLFKRIGKIFSGKMFTSQTALQNAGREVMNALRYYASQTLPDNLEVVKAVIRSALPWMIDLGYDVYCVKAGK